MWEEIQKFSDDPLTVCKSCEKEGGVQKLFSGQIAFHLKGTGWYKDGYSSAPEISTSDTSLPAKDSQIKPYKDETVDKHKTVDDMVEATGISVDEARLKDNTAQVEDYFGEQGVFTEEDGTKLTDPYHMGSKPELSDSMKKTLGDGMERSVEAEKKDNWISMQVEDSIRRDEIRLAARDKTGSEEGGIKAALKYEERNLKEVESLPGNSPRPDNYNIGPLLIEKPDKKIEIVKK